MTRPAGSVWMAMGLIAPAGVWLSAAAREAAHFRPGGHAVSNVNKPPAWSVVC